MKPSVATIAVLAASALAHPTAPPPVDRLAGRGDPDAAPKNGTATTTTHAPPAKGGNSTAPAPTTTTTSTPTPTPTPTPKTEEAKKSGGGGGGLVGSMLDMVGGLAKSVFSIFGKREDEGLRLAPIVFGEMNRVPVPVASEPDYTRR